MTVFRITPALVRSSLNALAKGKKPKLDVASLAHYLLAQDWPFEDQPKSDFTHFANNLFALPDHRAVNGGGLCA